MKQKLIKIGNSVGFILPKHIQQEMGLKLGDKVAIEYNIEEKSAILGREGKKDAERLTPEFYDWLKKFMLEHDDVLRELAKR